MPPAPAERGRAAQAPPTMRRAAPTGTWRKRGSRPSSANSASPCCRGVIASPGPPIGRMRFRRAGVVEAVGEIAAEIAVADRLAGRQRAVAEHQEGLAPPHALDLPRQRLEEGGRPDDRIGRARTRSAPARTRAWRAGRRARGFCTQMRREQHDVRDAGRPARPPAHATCAPMIDRPGVRWARRCARPGRRPARRNARRRSRRAPATRDRSHCRTGPRRRRAAARFRSAPARRAAGAGRTKHTTSCPRATSARDGRAADRARRAQHQHPARAIRRAGAGGHPTAPAALPGRAGEPRRINARRFPAPRSGSRCGWSDDRSAAGGAPPGDSAGNNLARTGASRPSAPCGRSGCCGMRGS